MSNINAGQHSENIACDYLQQQGLQLVSRNFHCRFGEIDLVMQDQKTLVFVEVRYRRNAAFGGALASITIKKQQRLLSTAKVFLQKNKKYAAMDMRFDVFAIEGNLTEPSNINWLQNAIEAN